MAAHRLRLAVVVMSALLLIQLFWGGGRLLLLSSPDPVLPAGSALQVNEAKYQMPIATSTEILARPLFWQGRKAFAPVKVPEPAVEDDGFSGYSSISKAKLLGVYSGKKPGAIVMLDGQRYRVSINEEFEGWTLAQTGTDEVVFKNSGHRQSLQLEHTAPQATAAAEQASSPPVFGRVQGADKNDKKAE